MREIKFRVYNKISKEMTHGGSFETLDIDGERQEWFGTRTPHPDDCELMQFTGLLDTNGKEIYENDVVKVVDGMEGELGIVQWDGLGWNISWSIAKNLGKYDYSVDDSEYLEIVGNTLEGWS